LEHVTDPEIVMNELFRVLKNNGTLVLSMPLLYAIHADPYDFQRWTREKIIFELKRNGYKKYYIESMGGLFAVIYDLIYISLGIASKNRDSFKNKLIKKFFMPIFKNNLLFF
jgi:SAM-dependent methyltransferase